MMKVIIALIGSCFMLALLGFGIYVWRWEHRPHVLEIYCFALDKNGASPGNLSAFIRTPDGHTILIDGGKSASIISELGSVMPFYRRNIDTVILTNQDDSHVTGLTDTLGRYQVGQVIEPFVDTPATSSAYSAFEDLVLSLKIKHTKISLGDEINLGDPVLSSEVLFPASSTGFTYSKTNTPVLAFLIHYGSTELFFGSDISKKEQEYIGQGISSSTLDTLLILPHGENSNAIDENFLTALNPQDIVITKKDNTPRKVKLKTEKKAKTTKTPFDISTISTLTITNLSTEGNVEFVSNGFSFVKKEMH